MTSASVLAGYSRSGLNETTMAPHTLPGANEAIVLRTEVDPQPTLWEAILPPEFLALLPGLEQIDHVLDDPVFFEPFVAFFDPVIGRPSIPMETYLRMMFLRFRYRLGFETLCAEVTDSLAWRRFCRIAITDAVPHPTTLMKITTRCGEGAVDQLNEALLAKAKAAKVVRLDKVRADTTVVPAMWRIRPTRVCSPKGWPRSPRVCGRSRASVWPGTRAFRDRTRSVRRRAHQVAAWLRRRSGEAKDEVLALTGELATIAEASIKEAQVIAINARRALRRAGGEASGKASALVFELERTIAVLVVISGGREVEVLNVIDDHSRLCVASVARVTYKAIDVVTTFHEAAARWGYPASMLSDNAAVFTAASRHGVCVMESELASLGIVFKHSRPEHPQTCGKVELPPDPQAVSARPAPGALVF